MDFRILGPLEVETRAGFLEVRGAKRRGLLALLLVNAGEAVPLERLVADLWADERAGAPGTVQTYVSQLRKLFAAEADGTRIATIAGGYRLDVPPDAVDAMRFTRIATKALHEPDPATRRSLATDALACWRGPALREFRGQGWADLAAEGLELRRLELLEARIDADLELGRARELVGELDVLVREHPLHERFWAQRMLALYRAGRQGDALRAASELRAMLSEELGIAPRAEIADLELRILDQDPTLSPTSDAATRHAPARSLTLPTGTVTFLLTDVVGSTELWDARPDAMSRALQRHEAIIDRAVEERSGHVLKRRGEGDSTLSVFTRAADAFDAALAVRDAVAHEPWPDDLAFAVRVAMHSGEAEERDGDYFGTALNRAARIRGLAAGGEILCSRATAELVVDRLPPDVVLRELGTVRLRGMRRREVVYRVGHRDEPAPEEAVGAPAPASDEPTRVDLVDEAPLVGRDAELERLVDVVESAATGRPHVVFLRGEAGAGKTRLLSEVLARSGREVGVHLVACSPRGGAPLVALADLVERAAASQSVEREDVVALLRGPRPDADEAADVTRLRCLTALRDAVRGLADGGPTALVVEDVHWADAGFLDAVEFLVQDLLGPRAGVPLVLVVTRRTYAVEPETEATLTRLERMPGVRTVTLRPLREVEVDELVSGLGVDPAGRSLVRLMYEHSRGNPLYVREALRRVADLDGFVRRGGRIETVVAATDLGAPADLRELVERRLAALPAEVVDLLAVAAVAGDDFEPAALSGLVSGPIDALLGAAAAAGIVAETSAGYRFTHGTIRAALYDSLPRERRRLHHRALATALDRLPAPQREARLLDRAHHLLEGGPDALDGDAIRDLWAAGRHAASITDWATASRCYEAALTAAGAAAADARTLAWMRYWAGRSHEHRYDAVAALQRYDEALRAARELGDTELWGRAALALATRASVAEPGASTGHFDATVLEEVLGVVDEHEPRLRARLLRKYGEIQYQHGDLSGGLASSDEAAVLAEQTGDTPLALRARSSHAFGNLIAGRVSDAVAELVEVRARLDDRVPSEIAGFALARLAIGELALGRVDDAARTAHAAFTVFDAARHHIGTCLAESVLADVALRAGDLATGEAHAREAERLLRITDYSWVPALLYAALADARSSSGDHDGARRALDAWRASGERGHSVVAMLLAVRACDLDEAASLLSRRSASVEAALRPSLLGTAALGALAEVARALHDADLGLRVLRALDDRPDPAVVCAPGLPFHVAWTRAAASEATGASGVLDAYRAAVDAATRAGAHREADRARADVARLGALGGDASRR